MSDAVIKVEGLGKKYLLRHQQQGRRYKALRDVLADKAKSLVRFGQSRTRANGSREEFWALRDVGFEIRQGEAVGIIGRNGAGKSTLLKLLSRITEPTAGRIELEGRVASLLEVGTGFHPELTGHENIFLNGAILGMSRAEIKRKFDEIVAFAEIDKFLDMPVKRYSSGMQVRLAFAVAAHLEPEILVVDEVLAVGDLQFQKKCLGKMEDVAEKQGRTVLFVSHNMDLINKLCTKALILQAGRSGSFDAVEKVTREYLGTASTLSGTFKAGAEGRDLQFVTLDQDALLCERLIIRIGYHFSRPVVNPTFGIVVYTDAGSPIFGSNTLFHPPPEKVKPSQHGVVAVTVPQLPLWSGCYNVSVWLSDGWMPIDHQENAVSFEFVSTSAPINAPSPKHTGPVHVPARWTVLSQQDP